MAKDVKPLAKLWRRGQRGQTLVEFMLTVPILLVLIIGMIDIGIGVYYFNTLSNCSREGSRFGIVLMDPHWNDYYGRDNAWEEPGNTPDLGVYTASDYAGTPTIVGKTAAQATGLDLRQMKVIVSMAPIRPDAFLRQPLTVGVEYPFTPLLSRLIGGVTITLKASSVMHTQ